MALLVLSNSTSKICVVVGYFADSLETGSKVLNLYYCLQAIGSTNSLHIMQRFTVHRNEKHLSGCFLFTSCFWTQSDDSVATYHRCVYVTNK